MTLIQIYYYKNLLTDELKYILVGQSGPCGTLDRPEGAT